MTNELAQLLREAANVMTLDEKTVDAISITDIDSYIDGVAERLNAAAASLEAQEPAQRKWSGLLVGSDTGLIGPDGTTWEGHPEHYERVTLTEYRHPPTSAAPEGGE